MKHILLATTTLLAPALSSAFLAPSTALARSAVSPSLHMSDPNYYNNQESANYYNQDPNQQQYYNQQDQYGQQQYDQQDQYNQQQYDQQQYNQQYNQQQQQQEEEPTLFLSNNMQEELSKATADFAAPIDYLALARQRAAEKRASVNSASTDADWHALAEEKRMEMGGYVNEDEGWEKSLEDEGNASDVAGLGMGNVSLQEGEGGVMVTEGGLIVDNNAGGEDGEAPGLLLY